MLRFSLGFFGVLLALGVAYAIWSYIEQTKENKDGTNEKENDVD